MYLINVTFLKLLGKLNWQLKKSSNKNIIVQPKAVYSLSKFAAFYLDDEKTIHGLDTLIEYYQEESHGLDIKLQKPLKGVSPPHDTRRHGRTNLLHRATVQVITKKFFL